MSPQACVGILLAGGAARRFEGAPKGLARIEGIRIADRALGALVDATDEQVVVINDPRGSEWFAGRRVAQDRVPGLGPLAGLVTALRAAGGASVLVVAWDMPFVPGALLLALRRRGEAAQASAVPVHGSRATAEPLCAYYRPESLAIAERLLAQGERRARALYEALVSGGATVTTSDPELAPFGDPARVFTSVDTLGALALLGGEAPGATRR